MNSNDMHYPVRLGNLRETLLIAQQVLAASQSQYRLEQAVAAV
jgi:hypothetical protein